MNQHRAIVVTDLNFRHTLNLNLKIQYTQIFILQNVVFHKFIDIKISINSAYHLFYNGQSQVKRRLASL